MPTQRQKETYSDTEEKRSPSLPTVVSEESNQEVSDDIKISRSVVIGRQDRYGHLIQELEKAKCSIRKVQLAPLSKVVNRAFTGWTIKTQS